MRSTKSLLRILGIIGAVIVLGAGIATANEGGEADDPDVPVEELDCEDEGAVVEDDECADVADEETAIDCTDAANVEHEDCVEDEAVVDDDDEVAGTDEEDELVEAEEGEGPPEGTHGFVVSQAAKDHSHDERCGNHGAYVSSVARGLDDCVVPPGLQRKMDSAEADEAETDDGDEPHATQVRPNGNGGGRPDHAGPPAGRGNGRGGRG